MSIYDSSRSLAVKLIDKFKNDNQVDLYRYTEGADGYGGTDLRWDLIDSFEAAVIPTTGGETFQAERVNYRMTHKIYTTYSNANTVTAKDRFEFRGKIFAIHATKNIAEADAAFMFECEEGAPT